MEHKDFYKGLEFWIDHKKFRCTDVGTRTIIAIEPNLFDASWDNGPPYAVMETVFDENDIPACTFEEEKEEETQSR